MPWDYYKGVGAPKLNNLDDLLNALKQMQEKYPKTPDGKPIVPITLWKDWDGGQYGKCTLVEQLVRL